MAGLLQFQGSELPESVRRAAQAAIDANNAKNARIPLSMEGSKLPESVRNAAQKYLWGQESVSMNQARAAQEAASQATREATAQAAKDAALKQASAKEFGKGLLTASKEAVAKGASTAGGAALDAAKGVGRFALGPVGTFVQGATHSPQAEAPEKYPAGYDGLMMAIQNPDEAVSALQFGRGVADRAVGAAFDNLGGKRREQPAQSNQRTATPSMLPIEPEKVASVETIAAAAPEVEAGRQRIKAGALQGLQSGEVHVSDLAKSVVEADEQRSGAQMKPEEKTQAVTAEIKAMKTMDKAQLSEYVSYALIAGGLLASVLDKSGQAGQAFHQSLNAQLDRNLQAGKMQASAAQAAAKLALEERKVENTETDTASKVKSREDTSKYQRGSLSVAERNAGVNQQNADTRARATSVSEAQGNARLGLLGESNQLKRDSLNLRVRAQDYKEANGGSPGAKMTTKDSSAAVDAWSKEKGVKLPEDVRADMTQALRNTVQNPATKDYAISDILDELQTNYTTEAQPWYKSGNSRVRRTKE